MVHNWQKNCQISLKIFEFFLQIWFMFHSVVQLMVHSCHISLKKTQFGPLGLIFFTDWLNSMCNSDENCQISLKISEFDQVGLHFYRVV